MSDPLTNYDDDDLPDLPAADSAEYLGRPLPRYLDDDGNERQAAGPDPYGEDGAGDTG